jgi:predicted transcriptional regulator
MQQSFEGTKGEHMPGRKSFKDYRRERRDLAEKQYMVAKAIGVNRSTFCLFEQGAVQLSDAQLAKLDRYLERAAKRQAARVQERASAAAVPVMDEVTT